MRPAPARRMALLLATIAALTACPAPGGGPKVVKASATPRAVRPAASATPTPKPATPTPTGVATPSPAQDAPPVRLVRPPAGTVAIGGRVMVDALYALDQGGMLISDKGGSIVPDNGGGLLGNNGASIALGARVADGRLIGDAGGALAVTGGGNLIAPGEAGAVAELAGGFLLANNGASIVSDNGGGLVGNNGGSLTGKTKYGLAQAAPERPKSGLLAPVAGMLVSVVSLRDRKYLPIGQDAAGQPVYGLYTNGTGGYEVFVPAAEAGNVLVVANFPGRPDPRMALNVITPAADAQGRTVDELAATTSRYLRRGLVGRMADTMVNPAFTSQMLAGEPTTSDAGKVVLDKFFKALGEGAARAGIDGTTDRARVEKLAQRVVDIGLAGQDLEAVLMDGAAIRGWSGPGKPALATMRLRNGELIDGTAARLAADPKYFDPPFLEAVMNAPFQPGWTVVPLTATYEIRKPADFADFMLAEYFGNVRIGAETAIQRAFRVAYGVAAPRDPDPDPAVEARVQAANADLRGAIASVFVALATRLNADPALVDEIEAVLREPTP